MPILLDITKDIPAQLMKQLKKTRWLVILTVIGRAEAVVEDAVSYQQLLVIAARVDAREGIR